MKFGEILKELFTDMNGKSVINNIQKIMTKWNDLKSDYVNTGILRFSQQVPLEPRIFTDDDVIKFQKVEGFKHVKSPIELRKVAEAIRKNMIDDIHKDIKRIEVLLKPYHGSVQYFDEGDRLIVEIDIGALIKL